MGIDWEYLLDAEGEDIQYCYDDLCGDDNFIDNDAPHCTPAYEHFDSMLDADADFYRYLNGDTLPFDV